MARVKYYYDTDSCKYERIKVSTWDTIINLLGFLCVALIIAIGIFYIAGRYIKSPYVAQLEKEIEEQNFYYELLSKEMDNANEILAALQDRDDNVYRMTFEAEPIPASIRNAGVGGTNKYKELMDKGLEREELVLGLTKKIDDLKRKMYIQTTSYDELMELAKNKELMLASMPAIQPVSRDECRIASGFGTRIDPFNKTKSAHNGLDFAAPRGTAVYATGNGVVKTAKHRNSGGYGKYIEIDHGFGYVTKYAHLNTLHVKPGQKVKKGEKIGEVGSTGRSTGPHLHYEVHKDGDKKDPVNYFGQELTPEEYDEVLKLASRENQAMGSY